ncbi:MAG TPA: peptidoglycan editing factor PgeF [bacterium]|nr:peptidoglycan editing factor PgeF [bacterium]
MTPGLLPARSLESTGRVRAAFTTRTGGISQGRYTSLNLAHNVGDSPHAVAENRRRLAKSMGARLESLVEAEQVHGSAVAVVGPGAGGTVVPGVDALVTGSEGIWLAIYAADCVPALVLDSASPAIAALHAGWRGTAAGIVEETLRRMRDVFGTDPARCRVALGPAIGGCCYEVDAPVARAMEHMSWWAESARPTGPGRWHLDLRAAIRRQFLALGVPPSAIEVVSDCTKCRPELFFSYRRDHVTGRMAACIHLSARAQRE